MATINKYFPQVAFHPGETLSEKLGELGLDSKEFAILTGKPEKTIIAIITGKSSITTEMAVQFEGVLNIPSNFWLKSQLNYDDFIAHSVPKADL